MALYEITYAIIPPGVGPDDYEPADLERRTERFELADPEPVEGWVSGGKQMHYGPHMADVHRTIEATLPEGSAVYVVSMPLVTD
ncbi:hypothetical protein ACODT5_15660 [Streptomyces sp. 5.8]|uniref:hypothetical protein n=1 Tax=Streptomyces sp. 5.8 TaxID=3406571 RepID=UPI003BB62BD8